MCTVEIYKNNKVEKIVSKTDTLLMNVIDTDDVHMFCGGRGTCGKCKVKVAGNLSTMSAQEQKLLTDEEIKDGIRLACLTKITGDCKVYIDELSEDGNISDEGYIPTIEKKLYFKNYGISVDIGTTTVVVRLYNEKEIVKTTSMYNAQRNFGADVISRIEKSVKGETQALAQEIRSQLKEMISEITCDIDKSLVEAVVITGNTAMLYLFCGQNPDALSHAPFEADDLFGREVKASDFQLELSENAKLYLPKCISAFVGADITCAIMSSELCNNEKSNLIVDIGTNGEIALWHNSKLVCCSTAAGPTFEGAGISMGMNGVVGAIEHVDVENQKAVCKVIGNTTPVGICGSGIVDAVAALMKLEVIDENGFMEDEEFELAENVIITQKDIRMVQLAKSAICAGILTLMEVAGVKADDIDTFYIAGGFGSYLDLEKGATIGLFPKELEKKAKVIGNAALSGVSMILNNSDYINQSLNIAENATTIELSTSPIFMDNYIDCMMFEV